MLSLRATRQSSHCEAPEGQQSNLAPSTQNGDIATGLSALAMTAVVGAVVDGEAFLPISQNIAVRDRSYNDESWL